MTIVVKPTPLLPWDCEIVAAVENKFREVYILTQRDDPIPYVVHQVGIGGGCYQGDYYESSTKAHIGLLQRAGGI